MANTRLTLFGAVLLVLFLNGACNALYTRDFKNRRLGKRSISGGKKSNNIFVSSLISSDKKELLVTTKARNVVRINRSVVTFDDKFENFTNNPTHKNVQTLDEIISSTETNTASSLAKEDDYSSESESALTPNDEQQMTISSTLLAQSQETSTSEEPPITQSPSTYKTTTNENIPTTITTVTLEQISTTTSSSTEKSTSASQVPTTNNTPKKDSTTTEPTTIPKCGHDKVNWSISISPRVQKVVVGKVVTLECQLTPSTAIERYEVMWFKKNSSTDPHSLLPNTNNWTLVLESVKVSDSGTYYCIPYEKETKCLLKDKENSSELTVYVDPNYKKHLLYLGALCALLLCLCLLSVIFNYKRVKSMKYKTESADDKETVWLL